MGAFHDAVLLYSLALNETIAENGDIKNGSEITSRMWNRTFNGEKTDMTLYVTSNVYLQLNIS